MRPKSQIAILTAGAALLFVGLRSLPDTECTFLHYQSPQIAADGTEFCGDETPTFIDLSRLSFPVKTELAYDEPLVAGEPAHFTLTLYSASGQVIMPYDLAVTHTERLHVLIVDDSLEDYFHVHPEPQGPSGQWAFSMTPNKKGRYRVLAEFVPSRTRQVVIGSAEFVVTGVDRDGQPAADPAFAPVLAAEPQKFSTRHENALTLIFDENTKLEPVMGALGHMVAFDATLDGFVHLHPKYTGNEAATEPELAFAFNTAKSGKYRLWAQVKIGGREHFYPFDINVE